MPDFRIERIGAFTDAHGDEIEVGVLCAADPGEDFEPQITIGNSIELDQEGAEAFACLFVSACWHAAREGVARHARA